MQYMMISKGRNRLVFIFPSLGLALKFPLIHVVHAVRQFTAYGFHNSFPKKMKTIPEHLFKGIGDNWREFRFYIKTRHAFCQPTYFSLFGLVNVQRAGRHCGLPMENLWQEIITVTSGVASVDAHHFSNPLNFCHKGGHLRILDYGHLKTQAIIRQYGDTLANCYHGKCIVDLEETTR